MNPARGTALIADEIGIRRLRDEVIVIEGRSTNSRRRDAFIGTN